MSKTLYEQDFVLWSAEQGRAIREAAAACLNTPAQFLSSIASEANRLLGPYARGLLA